MDSFSTSERIVPVVFLLFSLVVGFKIYDRLYRSPFASIPGPLAAKLTSKWILLHGICTNRANITKKLHARYGPIVQLAPKEISFSSGTAINDIYGSASTTLKPASYSKFGRTGIFHLQDLTEHKKRRKAMGDAYSMKATFRFEPLIEARIQMFLQLLDKNLGVAVDTLHINRLMIVDMASGVFWGKSFGAMEGKEPPKLLDSLNGAFLTWSLQHHFPLLYKLILALPIRRVQDMFRIDEHLYKSGADAVEAQIEKYGRNDSEQETALAKMLRGDPSKGIEPLPDNVVAIEAANAIFAATEATSGTLAYIQFELARNPDCQHRLRMEMNEAKASSPDNALDFKVVNNLPLLHGVIQESMRLHPVCTYAPRLVAPEGCFVDGLKIPGGTIVAVSAAVSHSDTSVYPDPEHFHPERWNSGNQAVHTHMMAWTKGSRVCAGQSLAMMEMKLAIVRLLEKYKMSLASEQTLDDMKGINIEEIMMPKGRKCMLIFSALEDVAEKAKDVAN